MRYIGFAGALAILGFAAGFMVAASASPAVTAALPVLAGLATGAIAALRGRTDRQALDERFEGLKSTLSSDSHVATDAALSTFRASNTAILRHLRVNTAAVGAVTFAFALFFVVGLGLGMWARLDGAAARTLSPLAGPWEIEVTEGSQARVMPPSTSAALYWLGRQQQLRLAGVPPRTVAGIFDAHVLEVDARARAAANARGENEEVTNADRRSAWDESVPQGTPAADGTTPPTRVVLPVVQPGAPLERRIEEAMDAALLNTRDELLSELNEALDVRLATLPTVEELDERVARLDLRGDLQALRSHLEQRFASLDDAGSGVLRQLERQPDLEAVFRSLPQEQRRDIGDVETFRSYAEPALEAYRGLILQSAPPGR
ncbi:MAG: hypothetical protein U5K81_08310 [Trueperaceae bacterium]|nr:hypothetical protein [Trueperaceae bacterium]